MEFGNMVEHAFADCDNRQRLLGNLLVLTRYQNTLQQGLSKDGAELSLGLRRAVEQQWEFMEEKTHPPEILEIYKTLY